MIWSAVDLTALILAIAIPIAIVAAFGVINLLEQIGGGSSIVPEKSTSEPVASAEGTEADRREEIRQMLEAANDRRKERGQAPIDIDEETERLLSVDSPVSEQQEGPQADSELHEEARQLVEATNERRKRRGLDPLDVEAEIDRRLRELI